MRESISEVATGGAVLAVAAGFLLYLTQSAGFATNTSGYNLQASFRSAEGVAVGTDIRLAGVKIGTITALDLNAQTYRADATLTLIDGIAIPDDSVIAVATEGLLGGTYVDVSPGGSFDNYAPDAQVMNTQGAISVIQLLAKFVGGGDEE